MHCHANDICVGFSVSFTCGEAFNSLLVASSYEIKQAEEKDFSSPMRWIGMYVAAASLICSLAMAADVLRGLKEKKHWFPCNYFTLNAASLTLLAIAVKLPVDLGSPMPTNIDQLAKLSGSVFVCTVMGNVMPSLGSMKNKEILMNVVALDIQVITLFVNICIQLKTGIMAFPFAAIHIVVMCLMIVLLVIFNCSALAVPTTRNYLRRKYVEIHRMTSGGESEDNSGKDTFAKLVGDVGKHWMMSETGCPQFAVARSATCSAAGAICLALMVIMMVIELLCIISLFKVHKYDASEHVYGAHSDYSFSTYLILAIQTIGILVGTIGPASRLFAAKSFRCSNTGRINFANVLKVEDYWIQTLVELKERSITIDIRSLKWKKLLDGIKNRLLISCITTQRIIVTSSKLTCLASHLLLSPLFFCCRFCKTISSTTNELPKSESNTQLDLSRYVLLLEDEEGLPITVLKNFSSSLSRLISESKHKQPENLLELLRKSSGFKGVAQFDSIQVPYICPKELPNCWMLPVVTLTSIAIALPNVSSLNVDQLLSSVTEGLLYVNLIEKCLNMTGDLVDRVEVLWLGVGFSQKWLNEDLQKMAHKGQTSSENLQKLADIAEKKVTKFKSKRNGGVEENPVRWPINVVAANSMYRISKTIMLTYFPDDDDQTDEQVFEKLCIMIADIIRACLTNLPRVITMKCFSNAIENREDSIQQAVRLLGETEEILRVLQQHELPNFDQDQLASINYWQSSNSHVM